MATKETQKDRIIDDLLALRGNPTLTQSQRAFMQAFANHLVKVPDSDIPKVVYATFTQGGVKGGEIRGLLSQLPEETELYKFALGSAPSYTKPTTKKVSEMFAGEGGEKIFDPRAKEYVYANPNIDRAKIRAIAKANGLTEQELYKALEEGATAEMRKQIAEGSTKGGWFDSPESFKEHATAKLLGLAFPRGMEAVRTGADYGNEDLALDVAENLAYTTNPVDVAAGLGVRALGKFAPRAASKATQVGEKLAEKGVGAFNVRTGLNAFANPVLFETADAIVKDDGPRAEFSPVDALAGGMTNLVVPPAIRRGLVGIGRLGSYSSARKGAGAISELEKPTFKEFERKTDIANAAREQALKAAEDRKGARVFGIDRNIRTMLSPTEAQVVKAANPIATENAALNEAATEIARIVGREGVSVAEATKKYFKRLGKDADEMYFAVESPAALGERYFRKTDEGEILPTDQLQELIEGSAWAPVLETGKFAREGLTRSALLGGINWGANKYGDTKQGGIIGAFPVDAIDIEEMRKRDEEERARQEEMKVKAGYAF